jgi:hypothetical protein
MSKFGFAMMGGATGAAVPATEPDDPNTIFGTKLDGWYDATDSSTDSMILSGSEVTTWKNKSDNATLAVDVTGHGTPKPQLVASTFNGESVIRFNGSNQAFEGAGTFTDWFTDGCEWWVVSKSDESGVGSLISIGNNANVNRVVRINDIETTDEYQLTASDQNNTDYLDIKAGRSTNDWDLTHAYFDNSTEADITVVDVATNSSGTWGAAGTWGIWDRFGIACTSRNTRSLFFDGDIAMVIVLHSKSTAQEKSDLADYLNNKFGKSWTP